MLDMKLSQHVPHGDFYPDSPEESENAYLNRSRPSSLSVSPVTSPVPQNPTNDVLSRRLGWFEDSSQRNGEQFRAAVRNTRFAGLVDWLSGPLSPRMKTIKPILPKVQSWPRHVLSTWFPRRMVNSDIVVVVVVWLLAFSMVFSISNYQSSALKPVRLACETRLWPNTTFCGLDGKLCEPFDDANFTFRCPSNCASVRVLEPHTIGNQEIVYRSMVIGGPSSTGDGAVGAAIYRGDSFICASAIHAGIFKNEDGGCGILSRQGEHNHFAASNRNGIASLGFQPRFPLTYSLSSTSKSCADPRWRLLGTSVIASGLVSMLTASTSVFVVSSFVIVFFQVALASDPPFSSDFPGVLSLAFERFLPTVFVVWFLYRYCLWYTLQGLQAHLEKTILWLGGCWIGALNMFDNIPISRLTSHDLGQQPGAITALIIIILGITVAGANQARGFRDEGRLLHYLGLYFGMGIVISCLAAIPGLQLRLHHYIIALLLLPGTSLQTRPSLLFQGILFGLFINGIARWGFASILQTAEALREDGQLGSVLPQVLEPVLHSQDILFSMPALAGGFDGVSVLVNDVERYQGVGSSLQSTFNWSRVGVDVDDPVFFRFAFTGTKPLGGIWYGDYTKPGTWYPNGTWEHPLSGPSR